MSTAGGLTLGERVAELRRRRGWSQRDLAIELGRSESWMSQVERDVLQVERMSVLQLLADALGASVQDLRPDAPTDSPRQIAPADDLAALRLAVTGHPALSTLLGTDTTRSADLRALSGQLDRAWQLAHASRFTDLTVLLVPLLADLEAVARDTRSRQRTKLAKLLSSAYQVAAASFARLDEADASWLAADRASRWAEDAADPLAAVAGDFRMAHAFLSLGRMDQAEHVATRAIQALKPLAEQTNPAPQLLSLFGAMHLLLAVVHAREGNRAATRKAVASARKLAAQIGEDRNDYNTEFGPTNVELHAVSTAVDLGDAGEAVDLAATIDASGLSPERQSRLFIDLARAHTQRRHVGDALAAILNAEGQAPEQVQADAQARQTVRDLLSLAGRRAPPDLLELARRIDARP